MLSRTSKLGCFSWSLQALETCQGSIGKDGQLVEVCQGCYATQGFYHMPDAISLRKNNKEDWQTDDWVERMVKALAKQKKFRWFDSGDIYSVDLAWKIHEVCRLTPHVKHWLPTRMHKFDKYAHVLGALDSLPNVVVRLSADNVEEQIAGTTTSMVIKTHEHRRGVHVCPSSLQAGKCDTCTACWNKGVKVVAYVAHSRKMAKVFQIKEIANV
jgi:hypothetical protein